VIDRLNHNALLGRLSAGYIHTLLDAYWQSSHAWRDAVDSSDSWCKWLCKWLSSVFMAFH